jgi:hypothetical protein
VEEDRSQCFAQSVVRIVLRLTHDNQIEDSSLFCDRLGTITVNHFERPRHFRRIAWLVPGFDPHGLPNIFKKLPCGLCVLILGEHRRTARLA